MEIKPVSVLAHRHVRPLPRRESDDVQASFNRAHALAQLERCEEAVAGFEHVLALRPAYAEAHFHAARCLRHAARCLRELGRETEAERHARAWEASGG